MLEAPFIHSTYDIERELNETSMFKLDPLSNSSLTTNENIYNYLTILNKELNFSEIYLSQRFIITWLFLIKNCIFQKFVYLNLINKKIKILQLIDQCQIFLYHNWIHQGRLN